MLGKLSDACWFFVVSRHPRFVAVMKRCITGAGSEEVHYRAVLVPCEAGSEGP